MLERPSRRFSLTDARSLLADLFMPDERVYWIDFLLTIITGHLLAGVVRFLPELTLSPTWLVRMVQGVCFVGSGLLYYRAAMFIHELVHLPHGKFRALRIAWNLLCGIPFLIPSFVYYTHIDHHRRKHFGTRHDGEYLPLGRRNWWYIAGYLAQIPFIPILAMIRFGIITPVTWLHPAIRRWVHQHASSMVMDPSYLRPLPTRETLRIIQLQELACFIVLWSIPALALLVRGQWPIELVVQGYCTALFVITLNAVRTIGSHRWWNEGEELTFIDQMLDSVTVADKPYFSELWGPVGTRFHSLHHLFPSLPYHNLPEAHRRLMQKLPVDSPYRRTVEPSLTATIVDLLRRSSEAGKAKNQPHQPQRSGAFPAKEQVAGNAAS